MNLNTRHSGFAIMNKELTGISLDGYSVEELKRYCRNGDVIVERIPKVCGFSFRIYWFDDYGKMLDFKHSLKNIFNLHWAIDKEYHHKVGKIVYNS